MESNFKKSAISSIITISLSLLLAGSGLIFSSTAFANDNRIHAEGAFTAEIFGQTFRLTPVRNKCLLEVDGVLHFEGTIEGDAPGTTRALVFATCEEVAVNPPGTFVDVFRSELEFVGTVDDIETEANITYQGITKVGGDIKGFMTLSNGLKGFLKVDAIVAVGGSYTGFVVFE